VGSRIAITCAVALMGACGGDGEKQPSEGAQDASALGGSGAVPDESSGGSSGHATGGTPPAGGTAGAAGTASGGSGAGGGTGAVGGTSPDAAPPLPPDSGAPPLVLTNQVDLLFVIDNSISMADKQELLENAVPHFVRRMVNPDCVDPTTGERASPPSDATAPCPAPYVRVFSRVTDLHLGILSSSLGTLGSTWCSDTEEQDDRGRLIGARPRALDLGLADGVDGTPGFLSWDPADDTEPFIDLAQQLVGRLGEQGCGFEATLEAWYRFLADPAPAERMELQPCSEAGPALCGTPTGLDAALLAQRAAFLRPSSALVVVMLSDENDCSMRLDGQLYRVSGSYVMPRGAAVCADNPNDPCCYSCDREPPVGCEADPVCTSSPNVPSYQDPPNLRCFHQVQRFGRDSLYPVARYARALSSPTLCTARPDLDPSDCPSDPVPNPIFSGAAATRSPELVVLMGIIGVPWQDIRATVSPDGILHPDEELHFMTPAQMRAGDRWAMILGDPTASPPVAPTDPLMIESVLPRTGTHPLTDEALAPPSAGYLENSINGHEWNAEDDLQFACIMPLIEPRDCAAISDDFGCDCRGTLAWDQIPLCQAPDGQYSEVQRFAKAYPGTRFLQVLEQLGDRAVLGSICARNVDDALRQDFGYGPATDALMRRLSHVLR
jgi:hypothetical protein